MGFVIREHLTHSDSLMLGGFLATIEVSIVSTALVDITNGLHAFKNSSWVINAYLLSFTGKFLAMYYGKSLISIVQIS